MNESESKRGIEKGRERKRKGRVKDRGIEKWRESERERE